MNRLDFTCIGPAINLAARLEKLAGQLGRSIIFSADFSTYVDAEFDDLGDFEVAGFAVRQKAFGLRS
jgi:adenylate cyclase